jgi:alpha-tubulin suppressor-like RCC1 family protein
METIKESINRHGRSPWWTLMLSMPVRVHLALTTGMILAALAGCTTTLTVVRAGSGRGAVTSPVGINCSSDKCTDNVINSGSTVTLSASGTDGSVFVGWGGACKPAGTSSACSLTMNGNLTAIAYYRATTIASGAYHTCGLKLNGTIKCWGSGTYGQLGDGTINSSGDSLRTVVGATNPADVVAGAYHTCILEAGGSVQCWGSNSDGQLGVNDSVRDKFSAPASVSGLDNVVALSTGGYHTCAVVVDGSVWCWGLDRDGQVIGLGQDVYAPIQVSTLNASGITAGAYHTCATFTSDGTVHCWGLNGDGQLGFCGDPFTVCATIWFANPVGVESTPLVSPTEVVAALGAGEVGLAQLGGYHTCALMGDHSMRCWGRGTDGSLGNSDDHSSGNPVPVNETSPASQISAGAYHTCAIVEGIVKCWGHGADGELGNGGQTQENSPVSTGAAASHVSAGGFHTCAVTSTSPEQVSCWGRNADNESVPGATATLVTPQVVADF